MVIVIKSVIGGLVDWTERTKYDWLPQLSDYRCANYVITLSDYNSTK